jgi:uncharacterized protein
LSYNIHRDHSRFRSIVKGRIKQDLKKYVTHGEMIGRKGKDLVTIPVPQIEIPKFRFGDREQGGVGQGDGEPGDPIGGDPQDGQGEAGNQPGQHSIEVDLTLQELAEILGEELELPRIEPRGHKTVKSKTERYTGIANQGPNSLRHFKRTFKETLRRQIASGTYDPESPVIIPIRRDMRYRSWKTEIRHENNAVIIYMMDVSGSMGDEQKEIVRTEAFWIDTWLRSQYKGIETRYLIHDATAREVDEETFFRTRESGGTLISSAYKLCQKLISTDYAPSDWNIYPFHFSDGDNWGDDIPHCIEILQEKLLPKVNLFGYGQVESPYGSGEFYEHVHEALGERENVVCSRIPDREAILGSIKEFLGTGR